MSLAGSTLDLSATYSGFQLRIQVSWDAPVLALFGASGSGKTTVLEALAGLRPDVTGKVVLNGRLLQDTAAGLFLPPAGRCVGWVPQDASLFPHMSVRANVAFGHARATGNHRGLVQQSMEVLEVAHLMDREVAGLSGGERQRVAVARAIASGAQVFLFDEPLASVDVPMRGRALTYFKRLRDELDLPIVYVTHDPHEVLALAGHVAVLEHGHVVAQGDPRSVFAGGRGLSLLEAMGVENVFEVHVEEGPPHPPGQLPLLTKNGTRLFMVRDHRQLPDAFRVAVRAEDILVATETPRGISAQNVLQGRLRSLEYLGDHVYLRVRCAQDEWVVKISSSSAQELGLSEGRDLALVIKSHMIRFLDA